MLVDRHSARPGDEPPQRLTKITRLESDLAAIKHDYVVLKWMAGGLSSGLSLAILVKLFVH